LTTALANDAVASAIRARSPWLVSLPWDLFFMFAAFWSTAILLLSSTVIGFATAVAIMFAANRTIALLHSWSTTYMVLASPVLREHRRASPVRYVWAPIAIVAVCVLLGFGVGHYAVQAAVAPNGVFPLLWIAYLGLFWVGHFWHFGNQDFGVLSLYRIRARQTSPRDRRADKALTVLLMFVVHPITLSEHAAFARVVLELLAPIAIVIAPLAGAAAIAFELTKPTRSIPKVLYYLVITSHPLLLYFGGKNVAFYTLAYLWSHWFIAIGLVGRINVRAQVNGGRSLRTSLVRHGIILLVIAGFVGSLTASYYAYNVFSAVTFRSTLANATQGHALILSVMLGYFLGEQVLHYYCDRQLFRFRDEGIRKTIGPLVVDT
jgi:hypothetical protein